MVVYIYTAKQVQRIGLKILGVNRHRQQRQSNKSNLADFKAHYCVDPVVCAQMWEDLQTTTLPDAQINATAPDNRNSGANLKNFLRAFHFLMRYGTELERKVSSGNTRSTVRKWTWFFVEKIYALRGLKVRFCRCCILSRRCLLYRLLFLVTAPPPFLTSCYSFVCYRLFFRRTGQPILLLVLMVCTAKFRSQNTHDFPKTPNSTRTNRTAPGSPTNLLLISLNPS